MTVHVQLITPERLALTEDFDSVTAPAVDGEMGILANHAPLLAQLGAGALQLKKGGTVRAIAVSGGFLEVQAGSHVSIFAETAEFAEEIDVERARQAAERAKTTLAGARDVSAEELARAESSLARALVRLKVGEGRWRSLPRASLQ